MRIFLVVAFTLTNTFCMANSLELRLARFWRHNFEPTKSVFKNYFAPNEKQPIKIKPWFDTLKEKGTLVSTGTERSFIDAALCEKCTGVVVRDTNPPIKAYNDFNLLLLKLAATREEYLRFRMVEDCLNLVENHDRGFSHESLARESTIAQIKERLRESDMIDETKQFYEDYFDAFANIYYAAQQTNEMLCFIDPAKRVCRDYSWPTFFDDANYLFDDSLFKKVQDMAKKGNFISTIGSIDQLEFLKEESIIAIDISNILDYASLDFSGLSFQPLIIKVYASGAFSRYSRL